MAASVSFESETEKQKLREIRRKERNRILKEVRVGHMKFTGSYLIARRKYRRPAMFTPISRFNSFRARSFQRNTD